MLGGAAAIGVVFAVSMANVSLPLKLIISAIQLILYIIITWFALLGKEERAFLLRRLMGSASPVQDAAK
jgi:hypothetical protein